MRTAVARFLATISLFGNLAITASLKAQAPPIQPQQTFRSAVDLVTIQASVRDKHGRPLRDLTPADFQVRDNGQLRPVLWLRADRRAPVSLAILVDMSGSMRVGPKIEMARQAFADILAQLRTGTDEVALFTFDSALHERHQFSSDVTRLRGALDDFKPFGTTSLYDATAAAAKRLADRSATQKAILVLTDGIDTSSSLTAPQVSALASSIDVPVYIVATVPSIDQRMLMEAADRSSGADSADLRDLAEWTGGELVFASSFGETALVASSLVDELRQQYVLAIEAANVREWRRLDVRVKAPAATVKARNGYFGG